MIKMEATIDDRVVVAKFNRMQGKAVNLRPPLKLSTIYMYRSINKNFQAQGRPKKWAPLKRSTIENRRRGKGSGSPQILQDTGILRMSVTSPNAKGAIYRLSNARVEMGTKLIYASVHQKGKTIRAHTIVPKKKNALHFFIGGKEVFCKRANIPPIKMPKREFLLFQTKDRKEIGNIFGKYMVN